MYLNINDLHGITSQLQALHTMMQAHGNDTFHLNLDPNHLLFHQQTNKPEIVISGWGNSITKGKPSLLDSPVSGYRNYDVLPDFEKGCCFCR
jgi:hypothetical protein